MRIERDGGDALAGGSALITIPRIEGSIGGDMRGKAAQGCHRLHVERKEVRDVAFIERLGVLGEDDIAIDRIGATGDPSAVAEQAFLLDGDAAIGLLLIAALFDA